MITYILINTAEACYFKLLGEMKIQSIKGKPREMDLSLKYWGIPNHRV